MLQAQLAARTAANDSEKPPAENTSTTKSKSKRKMSESRESENEAPVAKKEQTKPKPTKEKGDRLVFFYNWADNLR